MSWSYRPLARLLAPLEPQAFRERVWGRELRHIPGTPDKFAGLFDWQSLNSILNTSGEHLPLRLVDNRSGAKANAYLKHAQLPEVLKRLNAGATLVLEEIDCRDATLRAFLDALGAELGINTFLNLYLSSPSQEGFSLHYDTHDFLILQISGYKDWDLYPPTLLEPLPQQNSRDQPPPPESSRLPRLQLAPGDVLYVPKGYWHKPQACREPSLHLTLGLYAPNGLDLLRWLLSAAGEQSRFRRNLPLPDVGPHTAGGAAWQAAVKELGTAFGELLATPDLAARLERLHFAGLGHRQLFQLPEQISVPTEASAKAAYRVIQQPHRLLPAPAGQVELILAQSSLLFEAIASEALADLLGRQSFSQADFSQSHPELTARALQELLARLRLQGLIVPIA